MVQYRALAVTLAKLLNSPRADGGLALQYPVLRNREDGGVGWSVAAACDNGVACVIFRVNLVAAISGSIIIHVIVRTAIIKIATYLTARPCPLNGRLGARKSIRLCPVAPRWSTPSQPRSSKVLETSYHCCLRRATHILRRRISTSNNSLSLAMVVSNPKVHICLRQKLLSRTLRRLRTERMQHA